MKNVFSIGRDDSCDIIIHDESNIISRTHAFLRIGKRGRYTISDQSMNGTYVNGIRISTGVEVPVSRTDVISFAHVAELDWSFIPDPVKKKRFVLLTVLGVVLLLIVSGIAGALLLGRKPSLQPIPETPEVSFTDSIGKKEIKDTVKKMNPPKPVAPKKSVEKKETKVTADKKPVSPSKEKDIKTEEKKDSVKTEVSKKNKVTPI